MPAAEMVEFDNAEAGALYSQLTGLLAGFAFAGLVLILTRRLDPRLGPRTASDDGPEERRVEAGLDRALALLFASFGGLILSSLSYAVIGGEGSNYIASVEHVLAGVGFTIAALTLLMALTELLRLSAPHLSRFAAVVTGQAAPLVALLHVTMGAADADGLSDARRAWVPYLLWAVTGTPVLVLFAVALRPPRARPLRLPTYLRYCYAAIAVPLGTALTVPFISGTWARGNADVFWTVPAAAVAGALVTSAVIIFCDRAWRVESDETGNPSRQRARSRRRLGVDDDSARSTGNAAQDTGAKAYGPRIPDEPWPQPTD